MKSRGSHLFLAVAIPPAIRSQISDLRGQLANGSKAFKKLVHPDDYHITLKFLGVVEDGLVEQVRSAAAHAVSEHTLFTLRAAGVGVFGKPATPRILWLGVGGDTTALSKLQSDVEAAMVPLGFAREDRPYRPHITLAKSYVGEVPFELTQAGRAIDQQVMALTWEVGEVVLYRTHLGAAPMYEPVAELALSRVDSARSS